MMQLGRLTISAIVLLAAGQLARAQSAPEPRLTAALDALHQQYAASFPGQPQLFSGPEYTDYTRRFHARIGHQFFLAPEAQTGSVFYEGFNYRDVRLAYDVVREQLLLSQPGSPLALVLANERVSAFTIAGHRFISLNPDSAAAEVLRPGFYEVLVDSSTQVLAKRSKRMQQKIVERNIDLRFTPADKLYIRKGKQYFPITKKSAVLRAFADRSKEMQQYIDEHQLSFKKAQLESSVVRLARVYNQLPSH